MKKQFIAKVLKECVVDTRKYRYVVEERYNDKSWWLEIRRLPLDALDTTRALSDWETVQVIR